MQRRAKRLKQDDHALVLSTLPADRLQLLREWKLAHRNLELFKTLDYDTLTVISTHFSIEQAVAITQILGVDVMPPLPRMDAYSTRDSVDPVKNAWCPINHRAITSRNKHLVIYDKGKNVHFGVQYLQQIWPRIFSSTGHPLVINVHVSDGKHKLVAEIMASVRRAVLAAKGGRLGVAFKFDSAPWQSRRRNLPTVLRFHGCCPVFVLVDGNCSMPPLGDVPNIKHDLRLESRSMCDRLNRGNTSIRAMEIRHWCVHDLSVTVPLTVTKLRLYDVYLAGLHDLPEAVTKYELVNTQSPRHVIRELQCGFARAPRVKTFTLDYYHWTPWSFDLGLSVAPNPQWEHYPDDHHPLIYKHYTDCRALRVFPDFPIEERQSLVTSDPDIIWPGDQLPDLRNPDPFLFAPEATTVTVDSYESPVLTLGKPTDVTIRTCGTSVWLASSITTLDYILKLKCTHGYLATLVSIIDTQCPNLTTFTLRHHTDYYVGGAHDSRLWTRMFLRTPGTNYLFKNAKRVTLCIYEYRWAATVEWSLARSASSAYRVGLNTKCSSCMRCTKTGAHHVDPNIYSKRYWLFARDVTQGPMLVPSYYGGKKIAVELSNENTLVKAGYVFEVPNGPDAFDNLHDLSPVLMDPGNATIKKCKERSPNLRLVLCSPSCAGH